MVHSLWKTVRKSLEKLKLELPYDPATSLLGIDPKEMKTGPERNTCTPLFTAALFAITMIWKPTVSINPSMDGQIKMWHTYICVYVCIRIYTYIYMNITQLGGKISFHLQQHGENEGIKLSEISQTEKYNHCIISLICGIQKSPMRKNRHQTDGYQGLGVRKWGDVCQRLLTSC